MLGARTVDDIDSAQTATATGCHCARSSSNGAAHQLPHAAEAFGTLGSLYPGRIDLGLGRAPGTDLAAAQALRRYYANAEEFPADVVELLRYFEPVHAGQTVQAVPGAGVEVAVWILGSSLFGARLAAALGLPYAFASHFAPDALDQALSLSHREFKPSRRLAQPHTMLALNVVTAGTEEEAARLFTTQQQAFANLVPPPLDSAAAINDYCTPAEIHMLDSTLACRAVARRPPCTRLCKASSSATPRTN